MTDPLLYQIALTMINGIGPVQARNMLHRFGHPEAIFRASHQQLRKIEGMGDQRAAFVKNFHGFDAAEKEVSFIRRNHVVPLFITDERYPRRLLHCYDAPVMLYHRGNVDLNFARCVAVVGTRRPDEYGRKLVEEIVSYMAGLDVLVISGLAYGVDAWAHKQCLREKVVTTGVLAHGLDQMYPQEHAQLVKDMLSQSGSVLTEYRSGVQADKHNFPMRNRIVAGMSDATVVIQSPEKGGSIITAELANGYNRDVFACPGRTTDMRSAGCNRLIRENKALLLSHPSQLAEMLNWERRSTPASRPQKCLPLNLTPEEQIILNMLESNPMLHIDELQIKSGLRASLVAEAILSLELQNVILSLPGKLYRMS